MKFWIFVLILIWCQGCVVTKAWLDVSSAKENKGLAESVIDEVVLFAGLPITTTIDTLLFVFYQGPLMLWDWASKENSDPVNTNQNQNFPQEPISDPNLK